MEAPGRVRSRRISPRGSRIGVECRVVSSSRVGEVVDRAGREVDQGLLQVGPYAFDGVEVWCVGRGLDDGEPVAVAVAELPQSLGVMGAGVVPHHDQRDVAEGPRRSRTGTQ